MIKIAMTVRNRLSVTEKAIEALYKHTAGDFQLYIYNNQTNHRVQDHWEYFWKLYEKGMVTQVTFNTNESTFNAFSKASALNSFGLNHQQDPKKNTYDFLSFFDNDIIVLPNWDKTIRAAWRDVEKFRMKNVHVISQLPGGIKYKQLVPEKIANCNAKTGKLGGSAFWHVRTDFFDKVGFLDLSQLVGLNKKHDQMYWRKLSDATQGKDYILGVNKKLCVHVGEMAGSICNVLSCGGAKDLKIEKSKLSKQDNLINSMTFDEFYNQIINNKKYIDGW